MTDFEVFEGMRHGDAFVLTQTEVNRLVGFHLREVRSELRALRGRMAKWAARYPEMSEPPRPIRKRHVSYMPATPFAAEVRRRTYQRSHQRRYARYRVLCGYFGEARRSPFGSHLAILDGRIAELLAALPAQVSNQKDDRPTARLLAGASTVGQTGAS